MTRYTDAGDRDLDREPVVAPDGTPMTEADFDTLADQAEADNKARGGRPSLTGDGKHSPQVAVRLPADLNRRLGDRAAAEGKRVSDIVREAIEHYV